MLNSIILVAAVAIYILMDRRNKTLTAKAYVAYYEKKRKEFPWLDKWIQNNGNPAEKVAKDSGFMFSKIVYIVMCVIAAVLANNIPLFIVSLVIVGAAYFIWDKSAKKKVTNPGDYSNGMEYGLSLECPSCHCPHSWGMIRKEVHYLSYKMEDNQFTKKGEKITTYNTKEWRDFKCLNCGHTDETETTAQEGRIEGKAAQRTAPDNYVLNYDPPLFAWEKSKEDIRAEGKELYEKAKSEEVQKTAASAAPASSTSQGQTTPEEQNTTGISPSLLKAAEAGSRDACIEVAEFYLLGRGVAQDIEKAERLLETDRDEDATEYTDEGFTEPDGFFAADIAVIAFDLYNDKKNYADALALFQMAADRGSKDAAYHLGIFYENGYGVPANKEKAFEYYAEAYNSNYRKDLTKDPYQRLKKELNK